MSFIIAIFSGFALLVFFGFLSVEKKRGEKFFQKQRNYLDSQTLKLIKTVTELTGDGPRKLATCLFLKIFKRSSEFVLNITFKLSSKLAKFSKVGLKKLENKKVSKHLEQIQESAKGLKNEKV